MTQLTIELPNQLARSMKQVFVALVPLRRWLIKMMAIIPEQWLSTDHQWYSIGHNELLDELYTLLLLHADYSKTLQFKHRLDFLITRKALTVIWISETIATQTWQIFEQFNTDKQWSFTDCTSYAVMKNQGITEAFTFDHHFSQMGFIRRPD